VTRMANYPYRDLGIPLDLENWEALNRNFDDIGTDVSQIQTQVNALVISGDSSPEAAQARVGSNGGLYTTLKMRLDAENVELNQKYFNLNEEISNNQTIVLDQLAEKLSKGDVAVSDIDKNKGKFDQTYMTDGFLQQIAGTAPINAVPADYSITTKKLAFDPVIGTPSKNLFDKSTAINESWLLSTTGAVFSAPDYFASQPIPVTPGATYSISPISGNTRVVFYDTNNALLALHDNKNTFAAPANAAYARLGNGNATLNTTQFEKNATPTAYAPFGATLDGSQLAPNSVTHKEISFFAPPERLYSFKDAWIAWENNERFPVGFLGDSTTDGAGTSVFTDANRHEAQDIAAGGFGRVDYINTKAYPYLLEQHIKQETGQTAPRIYNIGYSGTYFDWAKPKLDDIFGYAYSDVKMVGISYGINDRTRVSNVKDYEAMMRSNLDYFINYFFNKGIQPFIVTSQATVEPWDQFEGTYPLRTAEDINSVANRVKREMANKYNLEVMEMTDFGEHAFLYSQYTLTELVNDTLHFSDKGNELEAGYLFSKLCPRVIVTKDSEILGFSSQKVKSFVPTQKGTTIFYLNPFEDGFKVKANYTKADTNDLLIQDFWVLNYSKKQLTLKAFLTSAGSQYVKLNGADINLTSNGQTLGTLDVGLHRIQVFSGASATVDFKGFTLT
jgi:hypothetical protein